MKYSNLNLHRELLHFEKFIINRSTYSMLPPGSADMSQIASILCGKAGAPTLIGNHGVWAGLSKYLASGIVNSFGESTAQYIPLIITEAYGAIFLLKVEIYNSGCFSYSSGSKPPPSFFSRWCLRRTSQPYIFVVSAANRRTDTYTDKWYRKIFLFALVETTKFTNLVAPYFYH